VVLDSARLDRKCLQITDVMTASIFSSDTAPKRATEVADFQGFQAL
jgi:hypothetical protein